MRHSWLLRLPLLLLLAACWLPAATSAQISLIPANRLPVARAPDFAALGDLDGNGGAEAVVASPNSSILSVYSATSTGVLANRLSLAVGNILSGVAVRDFDGDSTFDVLLADATRGASNGNLLLLRGVGNGFLGSVESFPLPISAISAFAVGDFDGISGPDAAISTGRRSEIVVLLNDGGASGFTAAPRFGLSREPRLLRVGRLDATGRDTIVALNTNTSGNEEIAFVRLDAGVLVQPIAPIRIPGTDPVDFVLRDFDRDGVVDIAVLQKEDARSFFITILRNQTVATPTGSVGTGNFAIQAQIIFDCPTTAAGDLTRCIPESLAAGDFDRDGFNDLAVAMSRPSEVIYLNGVGGGDFGVAGRFQNTNSDEPTTLLAGDMTGNRAADLFIGDIGNNSVTLLRADVPPVGDDGTMCGLGSECASTVCLDGVCCRFLTCPSGQRCDVPGREGSCAPLSTLGTPCAGGDTCASDFCVDGVCCANPSCGFGQVCNLPRQPGICGSAPPTPTRTPTPTLTPFPTLTPSPQPNGRSCVALSQCASSLCIDGICCVESCPAGRFCNISDTLGSCAPRKFIGAICAVGSDCVTGACSSGLCALAATATPTPTRIAIGGPCVPVLATACVTGSCTHGVCCTEAACSLGERCDIFGLAGDCQPQLPPGALCSKSSDCRGGAACELDDGTFTCGNTSATPGPRGCFGDCNDDGAVTVDEILVMIEIALGPQPLANCTQGDINGDAQISVDELLVAVGLALTGCPPPGEPTPSPAATSSATATVATPSATVAASPAAATPTATATSAPTPPGLDLSGFDEFGFSRNSQAGACPPLGAVFAATIERDGDLHRLEMDVLRAGTAGVDDCLPDLETEADCVVAQPVSAAPTLLTPAEQARFSDIFGNIELAQHPDESCVDGEESCSASRYFWDAVSANDDPCSDTNRLAPQPAATILQFLEELRAARESNGE